MTILRRCKAAKEDIRRLDLRIQQRREAAEAMGGMRMDPNGGSRGGGESDRMAAMAAEIDEIERKRTDREDAYRAEAASALMLLDMVPDKESEILHRYYLLRESTDNIARSMKFDSGYIRKKKKEGEELMRRIPGKDVDSTLPAWYERKWPEEERTERRMKK